MCGIAGIIHRDGEPVDRAILEEITRTISHRGPDGEGFLVEKGVGLGHRRLSIIDLVCGAQPMESRSGKTVISFNGEIFNYLELRNDLSSKGITFRTSSDTEVILELYERLGTEAFSLLNGQFALAILDRKNGSVALARDSMGEKPLYYFESGNSFVFGSEVKVIRRWMRGAGIQPELDTDSVWDFFSLNYVPFDGTMLKGVRSVSPGEILEVSKEGIQRSRFEVKVEEQDFQDIQELVSDAVSIRFRSDVPVGLFLSGGIDSTTVALGAEGTSNIKAYIANFHERSFSEANYALLASQKLGLDPKVIDIDPLKEDIPKLISDLVYHGDEPLADSSALPVYLLSRETSKEVKVVLSGDGGDELFGGYLTYRATNLASKIPPSLRKIGPSLARLLRLFPASSKKVSFQEKLDRFLRNLDLPPGAAHFAWNGMLRSEEKRKLLPGISSSGTFERLSEAFKLDSQAPSLRSLIDADRDGYLVNDILSKTDRMSMAHGLEVRPVFMDPRIVSYASSLSDEDLIDSSGGKAILRRNLQERAHWYPVDRPKEGFSIPVHLWFRTQLKEFVHDTLFSNSFTQRGIVSEAYIRQLWNEHQDRKKNLGFELWGLLVFALWMRTILD